MKIKIIKSEAQSWYSSLIGLQFDVVEQGDNYAIAGDVEPKRLINKEDCQIMNSLNESNGITSKRIIS